MQQMAKGGINDHISFSWEGLELQGVQGVEPRDPGAFCVP